jgi:hypothetical protein
MGSMVPAMDFMKRNPLDHMSAQKNNRVVKASGDKG